MQGAAGTAHTLTKEHIEAMMLEVVRRDRAPFVAPTLMMVPYENAAIFRIICRGQDEGWDRRRIKREMRKGSKSTYRRQIRS